MFVLRFCLVPHLHSVMVIRRLSMDGEVAGQKGVVHDEQVTSWIMGVFCAALLPPRLTGRLGRGVVLSLHVRGHGVCERHKSWTWWGSLGSPWMRLGETQIMDKTGTKMGVAFAEDLKGSLWLAQVADI